jgi:hypothetical protein
MSLGIGESSLIFAVFAVFRGFMPGERLRRVAKASYSQSDADREDFS